MATPPIRALVIHEEATDLLSLGRQLTEEGFNVANARTVEIAQRRLQAEGDRFDIVLIHWQLARCGAMHILRIADELGQRGPRFNLLFCGSWQRHDQRKGLQLGADAFLTNPISMDTLKSELDLLLTTGSSMSRTRLLEELGVGALTYDDHLWAGEMTRREDVCLAERAQIRLARLAEGWQSQVDDLIARLDQRHGEHVPNTMLQALREVIASDGGMRLPAIARSWQVDLDQLRPLLSVMGPTPDLPAARRVQRLEQIWQLDALLTGTQRRRPAPELPPVEDASSLALKAIQATHLADREEALGMMAISLAEHFKLPAAQLSHLDLHDLDYLAHRCARLGAEPLEQGRLHLYLLGVLLQQLQPWSPDPKLLPGLSTLLDVDLDLLKQAAVEIEDARPRGPEELSPLATVADHLQGIIARGEAVPEVVIPPLGHACRALGEADLPGGELERRRLERLEDRLAQGPALTHLPRALIGALAQRLSLLGSDELDPPPQILTGLFDEGPWTTGRLSTLVEILEHAQIPQGDPPIALADLKRSLGPAPAPIPPAPEPAPAPTPAPVGSIAHWVGHHNSDPERILTQLQSLSGAGDRRGARALRSALDLGPGKAQVDDVLRLLDQASTDPNAISGAYVALADLPDDHPRLGPICNSVALSLAVSGCHDAASAVYRRALKQHPDRAYLWFNFGKMWMELGRPADARPLLQEACRLAPDLLSARRLLTRASEALGADR